MVSEIKHLAPLGSSDHLVISFKYSCYADWSKPQHNFNYGKGHFVGARLYLDEHPIRVDGDVDSMWESFKKHNDTYQVEILQHKFCLVFTREPSPWKSGSLWY